MNTTELSSHFRFGENWRSFADCVDEERIADSVRGLSNLISPEEICGKSFLDIGSGSGLAMLAALRLGAREARGFDIDPISVETSRSLLSRFAADSDWSVEEKSILEADLTHSYDIVYSWGVLHHTGAMWRAMEVATQLVGPRGTLVIALYRKKLLCGAWRIEKRIYAHSSKLVQAGIRSAYKALFLTAVLLSGRNPARFLHRYRARGMSWHHDVHDWLGGYPYESAHPAEVERFLMLRGFSVLPRGNRLKYRLGILGTGCDEFVARRTLDHTEAVG